ncbi:zinc finger protein 768 [Clonorchis sinensis]|uniref:Zinc finger protein 768 n=1 Tax=Clonorchis sinensis TaxID=79923 RepID=H2KNZ1_CLOSI|nr:zinc finger protein 768 [Clonorchis sinensis]
MMHLECGEQPSSASTHATVPLSIGENATSPRHFNVDELSNSESEGEAAEKQNTRCCACGLQFASLNEVGKHLTEHHFKNVAFKKLHACKTCGKLYAYASLLKRHSFAHDSAQMFSCYICGRKFENRDSLDTHTKNKHPAGDQNLSALKCPICNKLFGFPSNLDRHVRTHSDSRCHRCADCGMEFEDAGTLHRHKFTSHSSMSTREVLNHECSVCKRWFAYKSQLQRHSSVHSGKHQYACTLCDRSYPHAAGLREHEHTEHRERQPVVDVSERISEQQSESKN